MSAPHPVFQPRLLAGQTALITGASSGINLGIAKRFAEHGANVVVVARNAEKIARACAEIGARNDGRVLGCSVDVRHYTELAAEVERGVAHFGSLDIVIAGAAGNFLAPAATLSANAFAAVVGIDLSGTFNTFRASFAHLRKPSARLLAISAPQATQPMPLQSHACAAKAGVEALIRTLAVEWGGAIGVTVNGISPGTVAGTEGVTRLVGNQAMARKLAAHLPIPRLATVDELADIGLFLVSLLGGGLRLGEGSGASPLGGS